MKTVEEVMTELIFSEEEKARAREFLMHDLSFLVKRSPSLPPGWVPVIGIMDWPVPGLYYISSEWGLRTHPITGKTHHHSGIDIPGAEGTPIFAARDGVVIHAGRLGGYGNAVIIAHGGVMETLYGHMSSTNVRFGKKISKGEKIGLMGSTGNSTGPHLHFEVRMNGKDVDPIGYFK